MNRWPSLPLNEVARFQHGGTPSKAEPAYWAGDIPWVSPKDMGPALLTDTKDHISELGIERSAASLVPPGTILVVSRSGVLAHTVPVAITGRPMAFNQDIKAIIVDQSRVQPAFVYWFLRAQQPNILRQGVKRGATVHSLQSNFIERMPLPIPPLPEQRRIVDILNRANGIRRLRREAQEKARQVIPALFVKMFGDPSRESPRWPTAPLREVAEIGSGITKGRRLKNLESIELPYLRVANVQDGYLNLEEIRTIDVHPSEVSRFRLEPGDLVMTEGGDPDKLGRAAIWNGEIQDCVHQNHVFRVRCRQAIVLPQYVRELAGSQYGKGYFLRIAKRTTGIATINKTQLGAFPIPVPPLSLQQAFASRVAALQSIIARQDRAALVEERLARSLMARVFEDAC